jgi:hypothetical protein
MSEGDLSLTVPQTVVEKKKRSAASAIALECVAGAGSAAIVAPVIAIVDVGIIENAAGKRTVGESIRAGFSGLVRNPLAFFRGTPFLWIMAVYGSTYVVGNVSEQVMLQRASTVQETAGVKLVASSTTNAYMSVMKDRAFAATFGMAVASQVARPVPAISLGLFALRDAITIGASFTAPPLIADSLKHTFPSVSPSTLTTAAQLTVPLAAQFINTPLYLLGLDIYNRPGKSASSRLSMMGVKYTSTVLARWARILPAFGIGGVANRSVRKSFGLI